MSSSVSMANVDGERRPLLMNACLLASTPFPPWKLLLVSGLLAAFAPSDLDSKFALLPLLLLLVTTVVLPLRVSVKLLLLVLGAAGVVFPFGRVCREASCMSITNCSVLNVLGAPTNGSTLTLGAHGCTKSAPLSSAPASLI